MKKTIDRKLAFVEGEPFSQKEYITSSTLPSYLQLSIDSIAEAKVITVTANPQNHRTTTYARMWYRAKCLLTYLNQKGLQPGDYIVTIARTAEDLIPFIWSCWLGGFIPIPIQFSQTQPQQMELKIKEACQIDDRLFILTDSKITSLLQNYSLISSSATIVNADENREKPSHDRAFYHNQREATGILFFTSGTTGKPKLVSFSHQTILNRLIENQPQNLANTNYLYWLPLDHASACLRIVNPNALQKVILPTDVFLANPLCWLDVVTRYKIKQTQMTNFGMALICQRLQFFADESVKEQEDKMTIALQNNSQKWDLRSLTTVGIGAETITANIYETFVCALKFFGLADNIFFVGYGLTECGTIVGGRACSIEIPNTQDKCMLLGKPCRGYSIRIVDEKGKIVNEDTLGYVQIIGPSTTEKYHNNIEDSRSLFTSDGWLKTGDLGFLHHGCLAITGRSKDIIIINAKNYSAGSIEEIVNRVPEIDKSATVACGIRQQNSVTDELVIFFHHHFYNQNDRINSHLIGKIEQIKLAVINQLNITPTYIIPLPQNSVPRTASGKVKRKQLVDEFKAGKFTHVLKQIERQIQLHRDDNFIQATTPIEIKLRSLWSTFLQNESIGITDNFFYLGGNSLLASQIVARINELFNVCLSLNIFLENPTIFLLGSEIEKRLSANDYHRKNKASTVIKINDRGHKTPIYFINSVFIARKLSEYLDPQQPLSALSIFGLTDRIKKPFGQLTIKDFARYIIKDLLDFQADGNYILMGFCQDGALTLEIAQQLNQLGKKVTLIGLIDVTFESQKLTFKERLFIFKKFKIEYLKSRIKLYRKYWSTKINQKYLPPRSKSNSYVPKSAKAELDKLLYSNYKNAIGKYKPSNYQDSIVSFRSQEWSYKNHQKLEKIASHQLKIIEIETLHNNIFEENYIQLFVRQLNLVLE